jgi:hypothetical protein
MTERNVGPAKIKTGSAFSAEPAFQGGKYEKGFLF